jgi:hypothetical protein
MANNTKHREFQGWITPVQSHHPDEPFCGLFAVRLHKNAPQRALSVICNEGVYAVYLDGNRVAEPSKAWRDAFGWLGDRDITGRQLSFEEYLRIVRLRKRDVAEGKDLTQPLDFLTVKIP